MRSNWKTYIIIRQPDFRSETAKKAVNIKKIITKKANNKLSSMK